MPERRRPAAVVLPALALAAALCASCTTQPGDAAPRPATTGPEHSATTSATATASPTGSSSRTASATGTASTGTAPTMAATVSDVATGLPTPWGLARLPDGSHLVSLRDEARVVRVSADGVVTPVPSTGAGGIVPGVVPQGEGGLLGLAVAAGDGTTVYAYLTTGRDNRVVAMAYDGHRLGAPTTLLSKIPRGEHHNGGRLAFGPDGMLYVTTGDAGHREAAQNRDDLGGKILRITRDGDPAPGNPFAGSPVWSYGHRNVQGIGWDTAGRMYASEFGQNTWDELNQIAPGRNYGWPEVEGMGDAQDIENGFTPPITVWATADASPSGLAVGGGAIYVAALRGQRLWRVPLSSDGKAGTPVALLTQAAGRLRTVEVQADGALLVLTDNSNRELARDGDDRLLRVELG